MGRPNLISWRWSLLLPTNPVWWGSMHAISSYRGNRPTNTQTNIQTHTNKLTHRQDRLQYTAPLSLARSVIIPHRISNSPIWIDDKASVRHRIRMPLCFLCVRKVDIRQPELIEAVQRNIHGHLRFKWVVAEPFVGPRLAKIDVSTELLSHT